MISRITSVVAILAVALVAAGCSTGEAEESSAPPAPQVTTAEVAFHDVHDWADFTGRLEAVESAAVQPRVSGFIDSVHFAEGGRVAKGDLLFRIDARPFQADVDRLAAEHARAKAQADLARSYRDRAERLLARNATSQEEFEQLAADADAAEAAVAAVAAALDRAELDLSFADVRAPIAGRVSRAFVTAGNLVAIDTVLTTVVADDTVYAYFDVDEHTYLTQLRDEGVGASRVQVGLIDEEGHPHVARLDFIDNRVDPEQGTIRARAVLDNPAGRFTPGLFARLKLVSAKTQRAALVDDRAIGTDLGRKFVFVVDRQGIVQYRSVETGRMVAGLRVVTSGLGAGDIVVVNGVQRVRPGIAVAATRVPMSDEALAQSTVVEADTRVAQVIE